MRTSSRGPTPFPWHELQRVSARSASLGRDVHRWLGAAARLRRFEQAFGALMHEPVSIEWHGESNDPVAFAGPTRIALVDAQSGARLECRIGAALASTLLSRLLRRDPGIVDDGRAIDDPRLLGALSALAVEWARAAGTPPLVADFDPPAVSAGPALRFTLRLGERAYAATLALELPELLPAGPVALEALGELPIGIPLVASASAARRSDLVRLEPGDVWLPHGGLWIDALLAGDLALAPATSSRGLRVHSDAGGLRFSQGFVPLLVEEQAAMASPAGPSDRESLHTTVLDAPVVVRVELGSVSLPAREWAELQPGDVLRTGQRLGELATLRVAGRVVASGELVNVEGELGVRIQHLLRPEEET